MIRKIIPLFFLVLVCAAWSSQGKFTHVEYLHEDHPLIWNLYPGISHINPDMTVFVGSGVDYGSVQIAVNQINKYSGSHWAITRGNNNTSMNEIQIEVSVFSPAGSCHYDSYGCTIGLPRNGQMIYAEIKLVPSIPSKFYSCMILHELGHAAGLDHTPESGKVMNPSNCTLTSYVDDDIAGLQSLRVR